MSLSLERLVLIARGPKGAPKAAGSGTLIAKNLVLTAAHVVEPKTLPPPPLWVRREGDASYEPATLRWRHPQKDVDLALLEAPLAIEGHALALLSRENVESGLEWVAQGYPEVWKGRPNVTLEPMRGKTTPWRPRQRHLSLDVEKPPDRPQGMSGAAVVISQKITSVVCLLPKGWNGGRLKSTPVAACLDDPGFRDALGLGKEDEQFARDLDKLRKEIEEVLRERPRIALAIAGQLELTERDVPRIAAAMLDAKAERLAKAMHRAFVSVGKKDRDRLLSLFWRVLPFATDWQEAVLRARKAFGTSVNQVELPLRSETIAQLVMAGADGRSAEWARGAAGGGAGRISVPANWYTPAFENRADLLKSFIAKLGTQGGRTARVWGELRGRWGNNLDELKKYVSFQLKEYADPGSPDRLPHYLLFVDAEMPGGKAGVFWEVLRTTLGTEFPQLRLVRLTGALKEIDGEGPVDIQISSVLRKRKR